MKPLRGASAAEERVEDRGPARPAAVSGHTPPGHTPSGHTSSGHTPSGHTRSDHLLSMQRSAGNQAVVQLLAASRATIQRDFDDQDKVAEDAVGVARGFAPQVRLASAASSTTNESGLIDGEVGSGIEPHAFTDNGKTADARWIHTGGSGGAGNEATGHAILVAPVIKTRPPKKPGGRAAAWVQSGTGTVKVKRSFQGVIHGINGNTTNGNPGVLWMSPRAQARIDKHERKHVKSTKEIYDQHIAPLESRVSRFSGLIKALKHGPDEQQARQALITRLDWNQSILNFQNADTAANQPMGTTDNNDMASADFYRDYATTAKFKQKSTADIYEGVGRSRRKKSAKQAMP